MKNSCSYFRQEEWIHTDKYNQSNPIANISYRHSTNNITMGCVPTKERTKYSNSVAPTQQYIPTTPLHKNDHHSPDRRLSPPPMFSPRMIKTKPVTYVNAENSIMHRSSEILSENTRNIIEEHIEKQMNPQCRPHRRRITYEMNGLLKNKTNNLSLARRFGGSIQNIMLLRRQRDSTTSSLSASESNLLTLSKGVSVLKRPSLVGSKKITKSNNGLRGGKNNLVSPNSKMMGQVQSWFKGGQTTTTTTKR